MKKKTLSLFLVLVMCLSLMPTGVFAQDTVQEQTPEQTETVAGPEQQEPDSDSEEISGGGQDEYKLQQEENVNSDSGDSKGKKENSYALSTFALNHSAHCICGKTHKAIGDHTDSNVINFVAWSNANALPTAADVEQIGSKYFYLTRSVEIADEWQVPVDGMIICLNGNDIIYRASYKNDDVITVAKGYTFTITDCEGTGKITSDNTCRGVYLHGVNGVDTFDSNQVTTFNLYGGKICNNDVGDSGYGGGMYLDGYNTRTLFNMYGGEISNNTAGADGGGIHIYQYSKINIYGGKISDNKSNDSGGGIFNRGHVNIKGNAIVSGNTAKHYGGGIYNYFMGGGGTTESPIPSECIIENSKIINNTAAAGGGIYDAIGYDYTKNELWIVGPVLSITGSEISGNIADANGQSSYYAAGGGIYIAGNDGIDKVTITNSKINNNTCISNKKQTIVATGYGGAGIYTAGNMNISNSEICGNTVQNDYGVGAGIHLCRQGLLSITDSKINNNTVPSEDGKGGGIYCYGYYQTDNPARIYLKNTSVTGNTVKGQGAGVYMDTVSVYIDSDTAKDSLKLGGKVTINNNTCGTDAKSNLLLKNRSESVKAVVTIGDDFSKNSSIGVGAEEEITSGAARDITDDYYATNYKDCFTSDNDSYDVIADESDSAYKVQLKSPLPKYAVTINIGEHAKVVTDTTYTGKATQNVEQGSAMETIKVVPENGYYFPTNDYSMNGTEVNGVKITQHTDGSKENTCTWLEISGNPSADTTITLADPSEARKVSDLKAESYEYDGNAKAPALGSGKQDGDVITGDSYTNAGTYKMKVTSQTVFDNDSYEAETDWTINKRTAVGSGISYGMINDFEPVLDDTFKVGIQETYYSTTYTGSPKVVGVKLKDGLTGGGDITVYYKDYKNNGNYTTTPPTNVGVYRVAVKMTEGDNFKAATGYREIIQFEIEGGYQAPPKGIVGVGPTTEGGKGYLSGTTTDMEYRAYYQDDMEAQGCKAGQTAVSVYDIYEDNPDENVYYARYKATETLSPSDWVRIVVPKYKPPLSGTVTISGDVKYRSTLTANVTDANSSKLIYIWKRDGEVIEGATDETYTLTLDDIGKTISVDVTSSEKNGILTAKTSTTVAKLPMDSSVTNAIKAEGYTGIYDGKDHTITVTGVPEGAAIMYGTSSGNGCTELSAPEYTNVEVGSSGEIITRTVYFKVSLPGYEDYTGRATVKIEPEAIQITVDNAEKYEGEDDPVFTGKVTIGTIYKDGDLGNIAYVRKSGDESKEAPGSDITLVSKYTPNNNYRVEEKTGKLTIKEKGSQNLTFADKTKSLTIGDKYTNTLTGAQTTVTYESSDTNVAVVNSATGQVTAVGKGTATITATAKDEKNYKSATESYTVNVNAKQFNISLKNYEALYDGKYHSITVEGVPEGATVVYGTVSGTYDLTRVPEYKDVKTGKNGTEADIRTVYVKVSMADYDDYVGSATVKINPVSVTIKINNVTKKVGSDDPEFTATVTGVLEGETLNYTLRRAAVDKDKNSEGDVITIEADYTSDTNYSVKVETSTLTITEKTPQNITFANDSVTANLGDTVTNDLTGVQTAVTYTSSNTDVAAVAADGTVTVLKLGKTTITARAASTSEYTEATASYELTIKAKVTMIDGGTDAAGAGSYDENETVTIKAGTRSGYSFTGWTAEPEVTFADASSNETTFGMPAANVKLTANWKRNSSSSGGSSTPKYTVTAPKSTTGGSVKSDVSSAAGGSTVTVTVTAEEGYKIGGLKVTDSKGNEIKVTDKGNGKYTFTMPSDKVVIKPAFSREASESENELPLKDVANGAYYYDAVKWAKDNGITGGVSNDLFGSDSSCTRGHIVTFLWRNAGSPEPKSAANFSDVSANSYYAKAVAWAVENGIAKGIGSNKFDPDAACTRAQSVTFLYRAMGKQVSSKAHFSDVPANSYYADAVAWAAANGVTDGIGNGLFGSDNSCTRAQIVTFLYRAHQNRA